MATDPKSSSDHVENLEHEAVLTGVVALASLFSNCVEAFGLIHPLHKFEKEEQLLLARLGLQQARLLLWGDVLGISSPPKSVTDRAVPKNPSLAYPDLTEPTFFGARDARLDEPETRKQIEETLSAILDKPKSLSREEMMSKYGLKPPKRFTPNQEPALDTVRLESFRERWELLQEVAESYAQLNTRRTNSIVHSAWQIADNAKFTEFVKLIQEKVDHLVEFMDVKEKVDRGVRMDIRSFGWHIQPDRSRVAQDTSKLRLLQQICTQDYQEYVLAIQQALEQIQREARETVASYHLPGTRPTTAPAGANGDAEHTDKRRSSGIFGLFKSLGKNKGHSRKDSGLAPPDSPMRSLSDSGPTTAGAEEEDEAPLGRVRSKSVGAWIDVPVQPGDEELRRKKMESQKLGTVDELGKAPASHVTDLDLPGPIRHDQYRGIARVDTKDLHQADY